MTTRELLALDVLSVGWGRNVTASYTTRKRRPYVPFARLVAPDGWPYPFRIGPDLTAAQVTALAQQGIPVDPEPRAA